MRERAPWYRRRLGLAGRVVVVALVVAAALVGFLAPSTTGWRIIQASLVCLAALVYLLALVRSAD